jgi:uncharacterized protein (DUF2267 family)
MKLTGVDVFDATIDRTNLWLQELMRELNWTDRRKSYLALRYVLHGLRDHLSVENAARFGNELPMLIRGFYFENWVPNRNPLPWEPHKNLLAPDVELIVRAVFRLLERKATEGEVTSLQDVLPPKLQVLWRSETRAA